MKTPLAVRVLVALVLTVSPARCDQASAREALAKEGLAFTSEVFLQKVAEGDSAHVKLFLDAGIDPSAANSTKRTALWIAVERKQPEVLKALLAGGVPPNEKNAPPMEYGKTI